MLTADRVRIGARDAGFDLCGIAPADAFPELRRLGEWLDRGFAGDMGYLPRTRARRQDVRRLLPSARSVIVTGTVYNVDRPRSIDERDPARAIVSRYAWGDDYHEVLGRRLDGLLRWMRDEHGAPFDALTCVDAGPVQERVCGQHAGLGWVGRNGCLINARAGSWFFLAEIVCSLPLAPDVPGRDRCGSCRRCLDACPTGALVEPRVVDARRCIAYLTIELKRAIPEDLRGRIGARIFGCDVCQDVCPWNRRAATSRDAAWTARPAFDRPRLADLWRRTDAELEDLLRGSAMARRGVAALRRNLAVAMGNSGDEEVRQALDEPCSGSRASADDPLVKEHVAWARSRR